MTASTILAEDTPARSSTPDALRLWLWTRALTLVLLAVTRPVGDVFYYLESLIRPGGVAHRLIEYPLPALWLLELPRLVGGDERMVYLTGYVVMLLAVDALFTWSLWRSGPDRAGWRLWVYVVPALGAAVLCRFDLFPAVLAAGGLLVLARRPGGSGVLVALGAAIKVWPVVVLPALLLTPRIRWRLAAVFVVVSLTGVLAVVATGGTERLLSPFQWRSDRGLQIEAFVALPALVRSIFVPGDYAIGISEHLAFEITGPWVDTLVQASSWLTLGGLGLLGVIWLRALVSRAASPELVGLLATLTVWVMIVVDKTFSPQYLTWVAALLAATAAIAPSLPSRIVRVMLLSAVGTQLVYPVTYPWLTLEYGDGPLARAAQVAALLLLIGRDACLIGLGVLLVRRTWALTRPAEPVPLPHPG